MPTFDELCHMYDTASDNYDFDFMFAAIAFAREFYPQG
jgi:hypothetical protein